MGAGLIFGGVFCLFWGGLCAAEFGVVQSTEVPKTVITSLSARVLGKGSSVEFKGNVQLTRGSDFLSADRLVTEDNNNVARAFGNVFFRREDVGEVVRWEAWGDRGVYDSGLSSGTLWGENSPARARRTPLSGAALPGGAVEMVAPEIFFTRVDSSSGTSALSAGIVRGRGGVYLKSVEAGLLGRTTEVWSDRSDFDGPADRFRMEGAFAPKGAFAPNGAFATSGAFGTDGAFAPNGAIPSSGMFSFNGLLAVGAGPPLPLDRPYARQTQGLGKRELRGEIIDLHPSEKRLVVRRSVKADLLFETRRTGAGEKEKMVKESKPGVPAR
jgi:hypothetical protein